MVTKAHKAGFFAVAGSLMLFGVAQGAEPETGPVHIALTPAHTCYRYEGKAASFIVHADKGEGLYISAVGDSHYGNGKSSWERVEPRNIVVSKVSGSTDVFAAEGDAGRYQLKDEGDYLIVLEPRAIQGLLGTVMVCRAPDAG